MVREWVVGTAGALASVALLAIACGDDGGVAAGVDAGEDGGTAPGDGSVSAPPDGSATGPVGPLDPAIAARAAVFLASCVSDDGINRTLQQFYLELSRNPYRSSDVVACLASKSNGCAALTECVGVDLAADPTPCESACQGSVYTRCNDGARQSLDCARTGQACVAEVRGCAPAGAETCDPATYQGGCVDGRAFGCKDRIVQQGFHCPSYGATCERLYTTGSGPDAGSMYGCVGAGERCDGTSNDDVSAMRWEGVRCDGDKLVGCLSGRLAPLDCATTGAGFRCFEAPDGSANARAYCGVAAECSPASPWEKVPSACEGTSVVFCNGGRVDRVDCAALGFTSCERGLCRPGF